MFDTMIDNVLILVNYIRSSQNYVSNNDPEGLPKFGIEGMSPELVKTATDMIGTMKPEELQKMFEVASSLNGTSSAGPNLGPNMPEMSPDMLKMASDMIGNMSPDELQKMMSFASQMGGPGGAPRRPENSNFGPSSRATSISARGSSSQPILENPDELSNDHRMGQSSSSLPPSTADMQETMKNSMKDPAMRQVRMLSQRKLYLKLFLPVNIMPGKLILSPNIFWAFSFLLI
jgi:hypothetical protein